MKEQIKIGMNVRNLGKNWQSKRHSSFGKIGRVTRIYESGHINVHLDNGSVSFWKIDNIEIVK